MSKGFFPRLALENCIKNGKFYFPYLLTVICTAAAFYICNALAYTPLETDLMRYAYLSEFMTIGLLVLGLFSLIFLLYTNSFLMKRRMRELGLYNVLGMDKRNLALVLGLETLYTWIVGVDGGILLGLLLQKLVTMLAEKLMRIGTVYIFYVSPKAMGVTAGFFGFCLLLTLLGNLLKLRRQNPVELLRSAQAGERQPKTRWLLALLGLVSLGGGYGLALTTHNSIDALMVYFLAVGLVIVGTYCLFAALSVLILKLLRGNRRFFYRTKNFIGVSGLLHRMNRNAVGLGNICILSTMVMVMISGTLSLYVGTEKSIEDRYPAQVNVNVTYFPYKKSFDGPAAARLMTEAVEARGTAVTRSFFCECSGVSMVRSGEKLFLRALDENGALIDRGDAMTAVFLTEESYRNMGGEPLDLAPGEIAASLPLKGGSLELLSPGGVSGRSYPVAARIRDFYLWDFGTEGLNSYYLVFPSREEMLDCLETIGSREEMKLYLYLDLDGDEALQRETSRFLSDQENTGLTQENGFVWESLWANSRAGTDTEAEYSLNGGFFFLGIFLGFIFIVAMALIMYYKQISEGYEDRERFRIMRQVGLTKREIKSSVNAQVLVVFFAPLLVAGVHLAFNFNLVRLLLDLFSIHENGPTVWCSLITFGMFAVIYAAMYLATARTYYKIVSE